MHPDLGRSSFALVVPAGPGAWVLALLSGDELAAQAAGVDDDLDVALAVDGSPLGASTDRDDGAVVDLAAVSSDARTVRPFAIQGGPLLVTVADVDGLAGGGWREPGLLLGAGIALSILVGSLILVLARGRAGALIVASEAQRARDRSEENFRAVVQHLSDLVVVTDAAMAVGFVTPSVTRLLGRNPAALAGGTLAHLAHPDDRALLAALASRPGVSEKGLVRFRHSDGSYRSFEVVVANRLDDPAIGGLVLTGHDVTDRVQLEDQLAHDATHDGLTGLPNLALVQDRLSHALVRAERTGSRVAVVFGDLDGFKGVNDRHGHLVGDRLLVGVAKRLRGAARAMDTVGRYAGDEFVVICEELDDEAGARLAAERLHREVAQPLEVDGHRIEVAMSLGVALAQPGESAESLLDRADRAMYRSKVDRQADDPPSPSPPDRPGDHSGCRRPSLSTTAEAPAVRPMPAPRPSSTATHTARVVSEVVTRRRDHGPAVAEQPVGARQGHIAVAGRAGGVGPGSAAVGVRGRRSPEAPEGAGGVTDTAPGTRRGSGTGRRSRGDNLVVGIRRRWRRAARLGGPTIGLVSPLARSLAAGVGVLVLLVGSSGVVGSSVVVVPLPWSGRPAWSGRSSWSGRPAWSGRSSWSVGRRGRVGPAWSGSGVVGAVVVVGCPVWSGVVAIGGRVGAAAAPCGSARWSSRCPSARSDVVGCGRCSAGWAAPAVPTRVPATAVTTRAHRWRRLRRGMVTPYSS